MEASLNAPKKLTVKGPLAHGRVLEFEWPAGAEVLDWERDNMALPEVLNLWVSLPEAGEMARYRYVLAMEGVALEEVPTNTGERMPVRLRNPDAPDFGTGPRKMSVVRLL